MLRTVLRRGGAAMRQAALAEGSTGNLLRLSVAERERSRRRRRDPGRDEFFVPTPESLKWLDSVTLPMILTAAAVALFTKLLMMEHEDTDQERRERKIKNSHPEQGTVRMLSREEWDEIQEVRPRTPFESKRMPRIGLLMCSLMLLLERKRVLSGNDSEERHSSQHIQFEVFL
ncbi:unnamed protein product [Triticum turgidum subsp. durum]|uniref:Uncharacterized protein n=1 Tax=Triticum turgidum subsp. durum TaxID=4567 RepID=A0A9R0XBA3_TRITD|nr:unnamed protein product [Triticum turgidum subsp. durum]